MKVAIIALILHFFVSGTPETEQYTSLVSDYAKSHYPKKDFSSFLYVSVRHQQAFLITNGSGKMVISVSTALKGTGSRKDSEQTPLGLHQIKGCIGANAPKFGILDKNGYTGKNATIVQDGISTGKDIITTRAFRLEGLEKGINKGGNVDSYLRDIMIHGTHEEGLIGQPVSHGCIRMRNEDILLLSEFFRDGLPVLILNY